MSIVCPRVSAGSLSVGSRILDPYTKSGLWKVVSRQRDDLGRLAYVEFRDQRNYPRFVSPSQEVLLVRRREEPTNVLLLVLSDPVFQTGDSE